MIVSIDPDVIVAIESDRPCLLTLENLFYEMYESNDTRVAVDNGDIEREYSKLYDEWLDKDPDHWIIKLFKQIFEDQDIRYPINSKLQSHYSSVINGLLCTEPIHRIESLLLGIVSNIKDNSLEDAHDLKLLLCGPKLPNPPARYRKLHAHAVQNQLRNTWPWLNVAFACETKVHSSLSENNEVHPKQKEFEGKVALHLPHKWPNLRTMTSPLPEKIDGKKIGDIDVYGSEKVDNRLTVVLGECKLREEGKESKNPLKCEDILKHFKRIKAIKEHKILEKTLGWEIAEIDIKAIFVSNAGDLEYGAEELLLNYAKELDLEIIVYKVSLTRNWERDEHWKLKDLSCIWTSTII